MTDTHRKPLLLFVGHSGSGKDFLIDLFGLKRVISRTTRQRRSGEINRVHKRFVTLGEMQSYDPKEVVAYTIFNGEHYCALRQDLIGKDVYVIDPAGLEFFRSKAHLWKGQRAYRVVFVHCPWYTRIARLVRRDGWKTGIQRFIYDLKAFRNLTYDVKIRN